jgi:Heavy metal binding domain
MKTDAHRDSTAHSCCGSRHHDQATSVAAESRQPGKKYFCPMCEDVKSETLGSCPNCGMALERSPAFREPKKIICTCPPGTVASPIAGSDSPNDNAHHDHA